MHYFPPIPKLSSFQLAFVIALVFVAFGNVFYFIIAGRLRDAGVSANSLSLNPKEHFRIYSTYRFMAPRENWPLWPLYGLYLSVAGMIISMLACVYSAPTNR